MRIREPVNAWSHFVGLVLATAGTVALLRMAHSRAQAIAFTVYGGSLVLLYAASTLYHALPLPTHRLRPLRTLDHIAIYFLIAGTYTPVALLLHGRLALFLLGTAWAIAAAGIPSRSGGSTLRCGSRPPPTSAWVTWPWSRRRPSLRR